MNDSPDIYQDGLAVFSVAMIAWFLCLTNITALATTVSDFLK